MFADCILRLPQANDASSTSNPAAGSAHHESGFYWQILLRVSGIENGESDDKQSGRERERVWGGGGGGGERESRAFCVGGFI